MQIYKKILDSYPFANYNFSHCMNAVNHSKPQSKLLFIFLSFKDES